MRAEFRAGLHRRGIAPFKAAPGLVPKELGQADHDLQAAKRSCGVGEHKWATIQAYYAMFHAARALLYAKGYREKSHYRLSLFRLVAAFSPPSTAPRRVHRRRDGPGGDGAARDRVAQRRTVLPSTLVNCSPRRKCPRRVPATPWPAPAPCSSPPGTSPAVRGRSSPPGPDSPVAPAPPARPPG